ncbi:MAG: ATP synthase F1 subunit delta [Gemmatimonadetes bacterium]|nr:ATP synthase F1 subunit delta [Gemmatimonadota bacterium]
MREPTIARNYAEALFELGERSGNAEKFGDLIEGVGGAIEADERIRVVLESPRVTKTQKTQLLARALKRRAPESFIRFLAAVVKRGRQRMIGSIAREYLGLLDQKFNRVHASVAMARQPDKKLQAEVKKRLTAVLGKEVIPHYREDPGILGGVIVRIGDRVMDGSLRRRMKILRRKMLSG